MLKGEYVGLRSVEKNDLPILLEWRNQPEYRQFFREYRELNSVNQEKWFANKVLGDPGTIMFTIVNLVDNKVLGACGLCYIDWINRNADFSIYIGDKNVYIANITGKKRYNSVWSKIVNMIFKLVKEGEYGNAA